MQDWIPDEGGGSTETQSSWTVLRTVRHARCHVVIHRKYPTQLEWSLKSDSEAQEAQEVVFILVHEMTVYAALASIREHEVVCQSAKTKTPR